MNHSGTFLTPRTAGEVFDLLANPEQFAPLLPNFESMAMLDPTHFWLRIAIVLGEMSGHASLEMELVEAERPAAVGYRGQGIVAGSQLNLMLQFRVSLTDASTQVSWQGDFSLNGGLAFMMVKVIEAMGREHFERMAERLRERLISVDQ
jgi:carbon monoxide dehydrogenase subunit G